VLISIDRFKRALDAEGRSAWRRAGAALAALALAAAVWLPLLHFIYRPAAGDLPAPGRTSPLAKKLAAYHLELWTDPALRAKEIDRMRSTCQEWDFMGRTYLVLALANMALREPAEAPRCLAAADTIIEETIRLEKEQGFTFFLMNYGRDQTRFLEKPPRSIFVDGEIALMLGARRFVAERADYRAPMAERVAVMTERMGRDPVMCAESYPNECWTFCNAVALAAMRMSDALDGTDHRELFKRWLATARQRLVEPKTGMLISSFSLKGAVCDGPEGSSIWMVAHCLELVDENFARDQYERARRELGRSLLGFGYAREWPESHVGHLDVDSGAVVPLLEASPSSSGLALMGAAAFGDADFHRRLLTSLNLGGYPRESGGRLRYCASNQVGDAVILYSLVLGPLWEKIKASGRNLGPGLQLESTRGTRVDSSSQPPETGGIPVNCKVNPNDRIDLAGRPGPRFRPEAAAKNGAGGGA
jgi:hypothetical protein